MGGELKASLEVDFSKAEAQLRELDRKQKAEDAKADILERRAQRIVERIRDADAQAKRVEQQLDSKLGSMAKKQAKAAVGTFAFDTLNQFTEGIDNPALKGGASIITDGLFALATSGNPAVAVAAMAMKAVEVMKGIQQRHAEELKSLREDTERRFHEVAQMQRAMEREQSDAEFQKIVREGQINFAVSQEESELIRRTWQLMDGLGGN
jgi:predicted Zn-dependent protease